MQQATVATLIVPLLPLPSQTLTTTLGGQSCAITVYQKTTGLYLDLYVSGQPIIVGAICRDRVSLTIANYLGFVGDLYFKDIQGFDDPDYTELGSRFILGYAAAA